MLQALGDEAEALMWVGSEGGMEADLVSRSGVEFRAVPAAGVHGVGVGRLPGNLWKLGRGVRAARRLLQEFRPDVLFFTGGYVAIPTALAGRRIPTVLYVPDIEPGLALKAVARFADEIALTAEESRAYFSGPAELTVSGYPTRVELARQDQIEARKVFGLSPEKDTLLVFGGSKGARSINQALIKALPELLEEMQIVHISGTFTWPEVEAAKADLSAEQKSAYRAFPYLHEEMSAALAAADLVVSRAGASILGEYPAMELPSILAPYPHAWRYQKVNADYLAERGGALVLRDEELEERLAAEVLALMRTPEKRAQMKQSLKRLAKPQAAETIAGLLRRAAEGSEPWSH